MGAHSMMPEPSEFSYRRIAAEETYPLRHAVLRPTQTLANCQYPGDLHPATCHVGCFHGTQLAGVGTLLPDETDGAAPTVKWRIRGMAVLPEYRGHSIGGRLLQMLIEYAQQQGGNEIWCNGRTTVQGFYERYG